MNTIYDYPIIGGIALGIRTIIDTVKYIFKKPILLVFPLIGGLLANAIQISIGIVSMLLYFIVNKGIEAKLIKLPITIDNFTQLGLAAFANLFNNFTLKSSTADFLGYAVIAASLILMGILYAISIYFYYWSAIAISNYIDQNIVQKNNIRYGESLSFANTKSNSLMKLALLFMILAALHLIGLIKFHPSIDKATFKSFNYFSWVIYTFSFFIGPLIAYKSLSFKNLLKENFALLLKKPFAIATISSIIFSIDYVLNIPYEALKLKLFILPIAQTILYLHINKKIDAN